MIPVQRIVNHSSRELPSNTSVTQFAVQIDVNMDENGKMEN